MYTTVDQPMPPSTLPRAATSPGPLSVLLLLILLQYGCDSATTTVPTLPPGTPPPQSLPTTRMTVGTAELELEIADEDPERETGLMYRAAMPAGHGMLFIFPDEVPRSFWMKNTYIPLDILYLDARGKIVSIKPMRPLNLDGVTSEKPAKFAIELNRGGAAATGAAVGDVIAVPPDLVAGAR
ncbi:MAG TPA: DUF192 domain-containing protein [Tepidisphaeraceae bacterium]